ncbi:MAG: prepilin peptidase [Streptococcaceae bacterium]|jgi:leader peptidase (prepilin peptidase)/N-methyltransferase|nr:prepilin peptidase [Streptococcaceae bacterium]
MFVFYFIIGCFLGSFFDCQVERLTKEIPLLTNRSFCLACQHPLKFFDLIPIFSLLILSGKCRYCQQTISKFHLVSEIFCGFTSVLYYFQIITFRQFVIISALYFISYCDYQSKSFPLIVWLVPFIVVIPSASFFPVPFLLLIISILCQKINIGIGNGDFLVIALLSSDLKLVQLLWLVQIASALGIIYFFLQKKNESIPFVPFLAISYLIILINNYL